MKRTALIRKKPLRKTGTLQRSGKLPAQSAKRKRESAIYRKLRTEFLAVRPVCEVWTALFYSEDYESSLLWISIWGFTRFRPQWSQDVHHMAGRHSGNYLNVETWMAVSRRAHDWIGAHPKEAEARGWIIR